MGHSRARLRRFCLHEIIFHWSLVLPYTLLGSSGIVLLIESNLGVTWISRQLLLTIHLAAGIALITLPVIVLSVSPSEPFARTLRASLDWRMTDLWWLHLSALRVFFPRVRLPRAGKFNAGQKLNLLHIILLVPLVAATGLALWIAGSSQLALRIVHVGTAGLSLLMAGGHIYLAVINPSTRKALGGMFHGHVDAGYAEHHHPVWFESVTGDVASGGFASAPIFRRSIVTVLTCFFLVAIYTGAAVKDAQGSLAEMLQPYLDEPETLVSPGPLHPLHSADPDLASCSSCHDPLGTATSERCLTCHEEIAARLNLASGYHGSLGDDCSACHKDHRPQIVDFDDDSFQHDLTMFALEGAHRRLDCQSCHDRDGDGRRSYLNIAHDACRACHEDTHGVSVEAKCTHCHVETAWNDPAASFSHDRDTSFALTGAHERAPCSSCHRTAEGDNSLRLVGTPNKCRDCHEDRHGTQELDRESSSDCSNCHGSMRTWSAELFQHDAGTRMPLDARHRELACSNCHSSTEPLHFRELSSDLRFASPPFSCEGCHSDVDRDLRGIFDLRAVEITKKSPHHGEVSCAECHVLTPAPLTQACRDCHPSDYDGLFVDWQARVSTAIFRSGKFERRQIWRRRGIHNWQGAVEAMRAGSRLKNRSRISVK